MAKGMSDVANHLVDKALAHKTPLPFIRDPILPRSKLAKKKHSAGFRSVQVRLAMRVKAEQVISVVSGKFV